MGWETRRGGYRYYVRRVRRGGRVERRCLTGAAADAEAAAAGRRQSARRSAAADRRRGRESWDEAAGPTAALAAACGVLLAARLLAAGYRRHDRGRWRKTRRMPVPTATTTPNQTTAPPPAAGTDVMDRLRALTARAQTGDAAARAEIGRLLDDHPDVWRRYSDFARVARDAWLRLAAAGDPAMQECLDRGLRELAGELGPPGSDPLERLLAERVATAHLQMQVADYLAADALAHAPAGRREAERRQAGAQHAFLQAVKALAACRKLLKPPPSPLDLLRPVGETTGAAGRGRSRLASAGCGAG
jgi:hypothetical protein